MFEKLKRHMKGYFILKLKRRMKKCIVQKLTDAFKDHLETKGI